MPRCIDTIPTLLALVVLASTPIAAQYGPDSRDAACFGVSFDRGCFAMLQYEVGYRVAAGGRAPRLERARPRDRSDRSQLFAAAGLMFASSTTTTLGAVYEAGTGDENGTRAIGIRWGRQLRAESRLDLTAGAVFLPLTGDSIDPSHRVTTRGAFFEAALHGSNALTFVARDELYAPRAGVSSGNLVFAGARTEATPAALITLVAVALWGIAIGATGRNW